MKKTKSKTKICLSLLIAMAFILPSAAVFGNTSTDDSTGVIDASEVNERVTKPINNLVNPGIEVIDLNSNGLTSLDWNNGWPVEVTDIDIDPLIAEGEYDITATFCRPDFSMGSMLTIIYTDLLGTVSIASDCDTVTLVFNSTGLGNRNIKDLVVTTSGGHVFDANSYPGCSGDNTKVVTFVIPRDELRVGNCNEKGFNIDWVVTDRDPWTGHIGQNTVKEQIAYDCGTAEIKKFLEIYKEQEIPEVTDNLYCTDFEDPCEFYDEWATYDKSPDWGNNGAIDTWTWTDKKSNSPDHSFHCTAGDTYLMNQHDILEFNMDNNGLFMRNETGVLYDYINVTWSHWMEGDSIIVGDSQLIQDGGYVEVAFWDGVTVDGFGNPVLSWTTVSEVFFDTLNHWEDEYVNVDVLDDYLFVRFVFFSDPAFCYEGWYVDDVCIDGIQDDFGEWEFVTDSHSHEQIMEGECIDHTFIESWFAEEGTYKICVWLQTLDDCHYAVHTSGDQYCIIVQVQDCLDYFADCDSMVIDPATPAWEHDDVDIYATSCNTGTLDGVDAQVQITIQYGQLVIALEDGFDCSVDEVHGWDKPGDDFYYDFWFEDGRVGKEDRCNWHFTDTDQAGDCYLANFDETTMEYLDNSISNTEWVSSPYIFTGSDRSLDVKVSFDAAWALPDAPGVGWNMAIMDDSSGYLYRFTDPYNPFENDGPISDNGVDGPGSWVSIEDIPVSSLIQSLVDAGYSTSADDDLSFMIFMEKDHFTTDSGEDWSGIKLDNFKITKLAIQDEPILFQETSIIDNTNDGPDDYPVNTFNISECNVTKFTWEDVGPGRYIITQKVLGDGVCLDEDGDNIEWPDECLVSYNVINYEQDFDDGEIEFIDHTCTGPGHWQIDDCCGGSFWCGDYETTLYGEFYDDCLYIAPYDEDLDEQNRTQDYGGKDLVFDTWYQINDTDDPANFSGDWAIIEFSFDGGKHWSVFDAWNGVSHSGDPEGVDAWDIDRTLAIPAGVDQIRFRFESDNDTVENRGWMLDNIFIDGIIDDDCDSMENFEVAVKCYGNWWQSPSVYYAFWGMSAEDSFYDWWHDYLGWYYNFYYGVPLSYGYGVYYDYYHPWGTITADPDLTYSCYDLDKVGHIPGIVAPAWAGALEVYPYNINNSFEWTFPVDDVFYGYIDGGYVSEMAPDENDSVAYEIETDSGVVKRFFSPSSWAGWMDVGIENPYLENDLTVRVTVISDDVEEGAWDGITLQDWQFHGMKDNGAPTTSITMSGTFDDTYAYYTSSVTVQIDASDDLSGVAVTYYEVDGTVNTLYPVADEKTISGEFTISGNGEHTLCYWSEDLEGNVEGKKCTATFRIDTAGPTVSLNIEPGIYLFGNKLLSSEKYIFLFGGVPMTATASADGAPLKTVEFYINDVLFAEDTTSPFAAMCREKNTGGATFKVIAEDVLGQTATDTQVVDTYIKIL